MSGDRGILAAVVVTLAVTILAAVALAGVAAGQDQVTLTVTVVDSDGDPVADADLTAEWNDGDASDATRSNGQALLDVPEGTDVTITVDHPDYVRNEPYEVEDADGGDVEVGVVRSGTATIEIVDGDGPLDDAIVRLRQDGDLVVNARTGDDGTLSTDVIEQDTYRLTTYKEGYERNRTDLVVDGAVEQTMRIGEASVVLTVTTLDDRFEPAQSVRNASVSVAGIGSVRTLSGGEATVSVPVNDAYEVTVDKDGYDANTTDVDVSEDPVERNVTINRSPLVNVTAANERVVVDESTRVTVVDEYGEVVEGATVSLDGTEVGSTDASGELDVAIESEGEHTVHAASGDGSLTDTTTVEGFETGDDVTVTTASPTNTTSEGGPGFTGAGALVALVALIAAALLVGREAR